MQIDNNKDNTVKRVITFAVPGSKVYLNDYYTNSPGNFLNISITGQKCDLMCRHCQNELLKGMTEAGDSNKLIEFVEKSMKKANNIPEAGDNSPLNGMLISGGFDSDGRLPVNKILPGIKYLKTEYPDLTIYLHTGFLNKDEVSALKDAGIDSVLVNIIGSQKAIEEVYNLKNHTYADYLNTIKLLKDQDLKVSPHIIIGLENGKISDEFRTVKDAIELGVDSLVFVILKKASKNIDYTSSKVPLEDIIKLVKYTRDLSGDIPLSFGCAKPPGKDGHLLEIGLIEAGIDSIAFPAEATIRFVVKNKIAHTFVEKCCAIF